MKVAYVRVSTGEQSINGQVHALEKAGCQKVFVEIASGARRDRPVLKEALDYLRPNSGDTLVVYKLDRVARSLPHLIEIMDHLKANGIAFQSLTEEINTLTPGGKLLFHLMAAISEFERDLIRERCMAGLKAASAKGRVGGRPKKMDNNQIEAAKAMFANGTPATQIAAAFSVSVPTLYRTIPAGAR